MTSATLPIQIGHVDVGLDVVEWAPDVGRKHVQDASGFRREATDSPLHVEDENRDVDRGEQIDEIAVDLGGLLIAALELVVDRGQLLVGRLKLFLRGLQLLVHALQLFVARDQLFIGRAELVGGSRRDPRRATAGTPSSPSARAPPSGVVGRPSRPWRLCDLRLGGLGSPSPKARSVLEQHDVELLLRLGKPGEGHHHDVADRLGPAASTSTPSSRAGAMSFFARAIADAQGPEQSAARHLEDVVLRLTGRGLKIRPGLRRKTEGSPASR